MFSRLAVVGSWIVVCVSTAASLGSFNFSKIYFEPPGKRVHSNYAVNDHGDVVFQVIDPASPGASGYVGRFGGSIPITVIGAEFSPTVQGPVVLGNGGAIAFQSFNPNNPDVHGIFLRNAGGQHIKDAVPPRGKKQGAPAMNDNGDVVFLAMDDSIQVRSGGGFVGSIPSGPFLSASLTRPAMNNAGNVVIGGALSNGQEGVAIGRVGGGMPITISGDWRLASGQPQIVNNERVLFTVQDNGTTGLPTGQRQHLLAMPDPGGTGFSVVTIGTLENDCDGYMNDSLSVASVDGDKLILHLRDAVSNLAADMTWTPHTLLSVGDALDGSTVTGLTLGDGAMLADNSVIFHATLANGGSGLYQVVVPEPAAIGALGASLLLVRRRR